MAKKKITQSLQIGNATKESSPVAAIIEMDGMYGLQRFYFKGDDVSDIMTGLHHYQDLHCLCRMAPAVGTKEDANIAVSLEEFLFSSYGIEDFDKFDFPFSIGRIRCVGWAKGENNTAMLKKVFDEEQQKNQ